MNIYDFLSILCILVLLIIFIYIDICLDKKEKKMAIEKKNRVDLETITQNIERDYKPLIVKLTSYEQEQEDNAVISYDELVKRKNEEFNYDSEFKNNTNVDVKKIDLENEPEVRAKETKVESGEIKASLNTYEKEEDFLKALKQLQSNLVR